MRRLVLALIVLSTTLPFFAQSKFTIRGRVVDALMRNELPGATVELLSGKDSSVISSIVANVQSYNDMKGMYNSSVFSFEVPRVKGDSYIIRASYIGFEIGYVNVSLADLNRREFERTIPDITLKRDTKVLDELEVVGTKVKFYYKGDTVVYNADAFVLAEGSMLDGLVRQLPGMEFGKDGNIYHNGKLEENLLLNGKLTIILDAFDILNQINNVTRVVNAQGRVETFTNALPRYAMLHMAYKLNIAPKNK